MEFLGRLDVVFRTDLSGLVDDLDDHIDGFRFLLIHIFADDRPGLLHDGMFLVMDVLVDLFGHERDERMKQFQDSFQDIE